MELRFIIFYITICCGFQVKAKNDDLTMIADFIKQLDTPTVANVNANWDMAKKANFISLVSQEKPVVIRFNEANTTTWNKDKPNLLNKILFLIDLQNPDAKDFLFKANLFEQFRLPIRWFIFGIRSNDSDIVPRELKQMNILFDSEVIIARKNSDDKYSLHTIYKKALNSSWYTEFYGTWTKNDGLIKSEEVKMVTSFIRRKNFGQIPLVSTYVVNHESSKADLSNLRNHPGDSASTIGYRQSACLFEFINVSKSIIFTDSWGYFINGTWNGMAGDLLRGNAEFGGTLIFINKQRIDILEYLNQPLKSSMVWFVFRKPPLSYQNNLLLLPFKANVWMCIGSFVLMMGVFIYYNSKWELWKLQIRDKKTPDKTILRPSISDVTILVLGAISQQGSPSELKGSLGRVVMLILFVAFLFLYTSYSACIVALLQSRSNNIRTLSDLLNSRLEIGVEDTTYNRYYFTTATEPIRKAIYETKVAPKGSKPNFMSLEAGVHKLQKEPFAFHMNSAMGYKYIERIYYEHEKCGLQELSFLVNTNPWFACRKASPYKEIFKIGVRRLTEHGLLERENNLLFSKRPVCYSSHGNFDSVSIRDCYLAFLMLLYGIILSLIIMLVEILMHRKRRVIHIIE